MKSDDVEVGGIYTAKISDKVVPVKIDRENPRGGWDGTNQVTNRPVRIKSARKLRSRLNAPGGEPRGDDAASGDDAKMDADGSKPRDTGERGAKQAKASGKAKPKKPAPTPAVDAKPDAPKPAPNDEHEPARSAPRKHIGRVSITLGDQCSAVQKEIKDLDLSHGHIAFTKNGKLFELYFREHNGSPTVMKAPGRAPLDPDGYRSDGAMIVVTGTTHVSEAIKKATGKTPGRIGISLKKWQRASSAAKPRKERKPGCLDIAADVLQKAGKPMTCQAMIDEMLAKKMWSTNGRTPSATLYSAITREIKTKGIDSRFTKVGRGQFALASGDTSGGES